MRVRLTLAMTFLAGAAFLELNGWRLTASEPEATHIIVGLAAGEVAEATLAVWFQHHSVEYLGSK